MSEEKEEQDIDLSVRLRYWENRFDRAQLEIFLTFK